MTFWRRVRAAITMGATWALGWMPIGALIGLGVGLALGSPALGATVRGWTIMCGVMGLVGGINFSWVLRLGEGHGRFEQLSLPRFAAWGAVGGFLLGGLSSALGILGPGLSVVDLVIVAVSTILGAGSAAGTLVLARSAGETPALEPGDDVGELGPTDVEGAELLG